ncbi:hypothetical protein IV38_GL000285 [Lactobacillus selangorensis]|uniref:Small ribosomal subunit protein bS20 n=1 Tax=Lactobacillus selangorensis TaxID=81857 RepID=A0A0R2G3F2_9LACO|nr:30S ribosomal protein S20 [Lactobacillus selangorensis]KRN29401.1 hypothetical protein IV38_GL000285 [Lactobacillus selangorensis]KRN34070.1 hypothetical protein IV40_GL000384 [Lactobacillus selangorensis]
MPQIKSAMKRVKTQEKAGVRNAAELSTLRTALKKFKTAQANGSDDTEALYKEAVRSVDMAKSKGIIKANKAARDKSRLSKLMAK